MFVSDLFESKSAPLYHGTLLYPASKIVKSNELKPYQQMYDKNDQPTGIMYASLTRDYNVAERFIKSKYTEIDPWADQPVTGIVFQIDQNKLSMSLGKKLRPFDDFAFSKVGPSRRKQMSEYEEIAIGGIPNFNSFVSKVYIYGDEQTIKENYPELLKFNHEILSPIVLKQTNEQITESSDQSYIEQLAQEINEYIVLDGKSATIGEITGGDGILNDITIKVMKSVPYANYVNKRPDMAYDPDTKTIIYRKYTENAVSKLIHELRHALDDVKSGGKFLQGKKTITPRSHSSKESEYLSLPYEINARFSQALKDIVDDLRGTKPSKDDIITSILTHMYAQSIIDYFPKGMKNPELRSYLKRAYKYIQDHLDEST